MAPRTSPGPTAAKRRSPVVREPSWKGAFAFLASCVGRAMCLPARSKTASCPDWIGSPRSSPRPAIRTLSRNSKKGSKSTARRTRFTSTATTKSICSRARAPRSVTRSSILPRARSARCASTTTSTASSISPAVGSVAPSSRTGRSSSIFASIRSSGPACPMARTDRWPFTTGTPTSFGGLCSWQQEIGQAAQTFLEFPPMQKGASFNLEALKAELEKKMQALKSRPVD